LCLLCFHHTSPTHIYTLSLHDALPIYIDHLLVVTFTNAAAAEMRGRIGKAIDEKLLKEPDNVHLQKQISLLQSAQITTIHSFCRSEEHTSELQSRENLVCRLLLEKKKK